MEIYESSGYEDTLALGRKLGESLPAGSIITLEGELGAGKTVFTKGVALGLGIDETVTSPTFTLLAVYEGGRLPLYHFDVYRIEEPEEMLEVGLDEYLYGDGICVIEWAERIEELLPADCLRISIEKDMTKGGDYRRIRI
ncbi:MAG: tRNA (adenosine(37)-N6)-threonylcarbamoyltransferase complex ATPase subunit type 1 TsaE [Lachnospiraceae bacterium]|nr:tRNA (adenosine(37)-N6)-threonylcarbamoyltransferase complex ATPase subunit type 1 TsaE [Lachnospiraceae bacterium]